MMPGIVDFCQKLQKNGFVLFVVTNQSGIARGFFDKKFVEETHRVLKKMFLDVGVDFKKFYYCPHHPMFGCKKECFCRKPAPGMILKAADEYNIDLDKSLMFGDKKLDIYAGTRARCKSFYIQEVLKEVFRLEDLF